MAPALCQRSPQAFRFRGPRSGCGARAKPAWPGGRHTARPLRHGRRKRYRPLLLRLPHPASVTAFRANGAGHLMHCGSLALHPVRVLISRQRDDISSRLKSPWAEGQVDDDRLGGAARRWTAFGRGRCPQTGTYLGQWRAIVTFGRIGRRRQVRRHAFEDEAGMSPFVRRALLRRRESATSRIDITRRNRLAVAASTAGTSLCALTR